jgi:DNA invertase Pin-like site-specific DNA recombinase
MVLVIDMLDERVADASESRRWRSPVASADVVSRPCAKFKRGGKMTGTGLSKLVVTILSAVAEAERDRIRERVTKVKRDQRQRNRYLGGIVPFGFRVGDEGSLVPDAAEQTLIVHARGLRADGATLRAIQAALEVQHGRRLSLDALQRLLADAPVADSGRVAPSAVC